MVPGGQLEYTDEPRFRWQADEFATLLRWGAEQGMSDLAVYPKSPVWIRRNGNWIQVTRRKIATEELYSILDTISNNQAASSEIKRGEDMDFGYEVYIERGIRRRFRVCATACKDGWGTGVSMVFRAIPEHPPQLQDLDIEKEIIQAAFPNNGLVMVTGTMGSGKSTTLAAMLRHIGENHHKHIVTYEAPIEFDLMSLPDLTGPVIQSAVPIHLKDFLSGIRNSTRRAPDVILVGESRDPETLRGMIEAAEIGVTAYSTVHTRSVAETPARIINMFPASQQQQVATTMLASLRLIIQQRLLPDTSGGRMAVREYLAFTTQIRRELMQTPVHGLIARIENYVQEQGQPLLKTAGQMYDAGKITEQQLQQLIREKEGGVQCSGETQPYIPN
jgi:defect-in-organelle-trafficking protein DotB